MNVIDRLRKVQDLEIEHKKNPSAESRYQIDRLNWEIKDDFEEIKRNLRKSGAPEEEFDSKLAEVFRHAFPMSNGAEQVFDMRFLYIQGEIGKEKPKNTSGENVIEKEKKKTFIESVLGFFVCKPFGHHRNNWWIGKYRPRVCSRCSENIGK